jgi:tRNA-splicing ligase RtcB (3'-phosphate/5'-hydroxy nucleic acid ligase)
MFLTREKSKYTEIYDPKTMQVPLFTWAQDLDHGTLEQAREITRLPIVHHHVALMPDAHLGIGATIGSVFGTIGAVIPSAVGVDIGCGMCAIPTRNRAQEMADSEALQNAQQAAFRAVPLGFEGHKSAQAWKSDKPNSGFDYQSIHEEINRDIHDQAPFKLGSLGGGNHFIEFQRDEDGYLWIMIHSGSRNVGFKIANFYMKKAAAITAKIDPSVPKSLAWLPADDEEGQGYINDMTWALNYAFENRMRMVQRILHSFMEAASYAHIEVLIDEKDLINIHHNYASFERHFGRDVWMHRKGATLASKETVGIIPGSMNAHSYIVRGLGNPDSFQSCSHGAGRLLSRAAAKSAISQEDLRLALRGVKVLHKSDIRDEAPAAYKNIASVMESQSDLVEIVHELTPLAGIKG